MAMPTELVGLSVSWGPSSSDSLVSGSVDPELSDSSLVPSGQGVWPEAGPGLRGSLGAAAREATPPRGGRPLATTGLWA